MQFNTQPLWTVLWGQMVKRCHNFTSEWEEKARTYPGNMFKKLIYVSCWALHLQFKQNPTLPPHRVYFIRYEGVTRSHVIKTVINWKEKVPPEFWEAVNFICLTALLLVLFSVWAYFVLKSNPPCPFPIYPKYSVYSLISIIKPNK